MVFVRQSAIIVIAVLAFLSAPLSAGAEPGSESEWHQIDNRIRLSATPSTKFEVSNAGVRLDSGTMLIEALEPTKVSLPMSAVEVKAKSLVFLRSEAGCEHIFVLLGSAPVIVGRHKTSLNTGEEVVVTDHEPKYSDLVGQDDIGRRRLRLTPLPEHKIVVLSEFSLIQAVEREPLIHDLINSGDAHDRALKGRLIKTAAVLNIVTARHGQYSTGSR